MQLIVNDHWQLALEAGCDFVHLGQGDLDGADVTALRRAGVRLGVSTHDEGELSRALALQPDYVALGPIYPTLLKAMPWPPQGLERITQWKRRIGAIPLVAVGGLTLERLPGVFAAGADVAAVGADIVRHLNPEARGRGWLGAARAPRSRAPRPGRSVRTPVDSSRSRRRGSGTSRGRERRGGGGGRAGLRGAAVPHRRGSRATADRRPRSRGGIEP